jgi:hypothetical protein
MPAAAGDAAGDGFAERPTRAVEKKDEDVSDLRHPKSKRADVMAVALALLGLAGLGVSAGDLVGGPALWPSFSGEHVYTARLSPAEADAHTPHVVPYAAPRPAASDELALRWINKAARGVCQSEADARRQTRSESGRRTRRQRTPPRRPLTLLTAATSGRPANS